MGKEMRLKGRTDCGLYFLDSLITFGTSSPVSLREWRNCNLGLDEGIVCVTLAPPSPYGSVSIFVA